MLGAFDLLLGLPAFAVLAQPAAGARERRDGAWWAAFVLTTAIPAISFYVFMFIGAQAFKPNVLFPQSITNQILTWALLNAAITLLLGLMLPRGDKSAPDRWPAAMGIALATVGTGYAALLAADFLFKLDFRFWIVALKLLSLAQFKAFLAYLVPFTAFFLVSLSALQRSLTVRGDRRLATYATAIGAMSLGFLIFVVAQYVPLFLTGHLPVPMEALNAIISLQFLPVLAVVGLIAAFTARRTGSALPGALICSLFVTWYVVAGTATQYGGPL